MTLVEQELKEVYAQCDGLQDSAGTKVIKDKLRHNVNFYSVGPFLFKRQPTHRVEAEDAIIS